MLWRGDGVGQQPARGLALLILADESVRTKGREDEWICELYAKLVAEADNATRKEANAMLAELGGPNRAKAIATKARASRTAKQEPQLGPVELTPPAAMGLSAGFGTSGDGLGFQP